MPADRALDHRVAIDLAARVALGDRVVRVPERPECLVLADRRARLGRRLAAHRVARHEQRAAGESATTRWRSGGSATPLGGVGVGATTGRTRDVGDGLGCSVVGSAGVGGGRVGMHARMVRSRVGGAGARVQRVRRTTGPRSPPAAAQRMRYVRTDTHDPRMPSPTPAPMTSVDEVAGQRAELERQHPEEIDHEAAQRIGRRREDAERDRRAEEPDEAPSKTNGQRMNASDAPTRRMISISSARATTARRIVLTMMNSAMMPTTTSSDRPRRPQDVRDGQDPLDQLLDVDDVADDARRGRSITDDRDRRRSQLDLEARVERVAVEVPGQVLAALRPHRRAEAVERLVPADVRRPTRPRASPDRRLERRTWRSSRSAGGRRRLRPSAR